MEHFRGRLGAFLLIWAGSWLLAACSARADAPGDHDALLVRVIHPDRQADRLLKLFEGSRAPHPAAALAAWKRATRDPAQLGKTLEAVIALANPEMVTEWRIFHQAELRLNQGADDATPCWNFVAPRDDGTAASMITAFWLSDLEDLPLIDQHGQEYVVARLSKTSSAVMSHVGTKLVLAGSRDEFGRAVRRLVGGLPSIESPVIATAGESDRDLAMSRLASKIDSGLVFDLRPQRIATPLAGSLELRRAVELLHSLGCRQMIGTFGLDGDWIALDVTTHLEAADRPSRAETEASVESGWLELIPARNLIGVVSLALDSSPRFWDHLFAVADRLERVDPRQRDVAPLRTRFNLLAATAGVRPEADLWPRLRGVTAAAVADPQAPRRLSGAILALHADTAASARRLADEFIPRLGALATGKRTTDPPPDAAQLSQRAADGGAPEAAAVAPRRLGKVGGRSLAVCRRDRDVLIAWGDEGLVEFLKGSCTPGASAASVCACWAREKKPAPRRVGALWPARLVPMLSGAAGATLAARVLADDPPLVWWGWTETTRAHDVVSWTHLGRRVQRFLSELPMDAPPFR
jgi:hypothetical protein